MYGGADRLTCSSENVTGDYMLCKDLNIPKCVDRTVYCSFPPDVANPTSLTILENPSPYYRNAESKYQIIFSKYICNSSLNLV